MEQRSSSSSRVWGRVVMNWAMVSGLKLVGEVSGLLCLRM